MEFTYHLKFSLTIVKYVTKHPYHSPIIQTWLFSMLYGYGKQHWFVWCKCWGFWGRGAMWCKLQQLPFRHVIVVGVIFGLWISKMLSHKHMYKLVVILNYYK